ncbi:MAG: Lrp/AsnC ligand binding domain-containing protein [Thaumarchaeota archaeon]|nr:Lrp/AsnC ligand binding domain-containing protein [Nitrososphaerota archaeon]MBI3642243.1 Lrp/AsnC ligand binding domain-containing protein [Nitrososphaerota archaeon]
MELAYVLVKAKMGHEVDVMNDILKIDSVKEVLGTYGQYDIFVKVQVPTRSEIELIITKKIRRVSNVLSTTTLSVIPGQGDK